MLASAPRTVSAGAYSLSMPVGRKKDPKRQEGRVRRRLHATESGGWSHARVPTLLIAVLESGAAAAVPLQRWAGAGDG